METILNWLAESAAERKLIFVRAGAELLVRRACSIAERNLAQGLVPVQFSKALIAYCPWLAAKPAAAAGMKKWNRLSRRRITKHVEEITQWLVDVAEQSQLPFSLSNARIVVECAIARLG